MKPITIKYRPISFIPFYRTVTGNFPQNWGEINAAQLIAIACLYKGASTDLKFLKTMTGLPARVLKRTDDYERFKLMEQLEFLSDRRAYHEFIITTIRSTKLRSLSLSKGCLHAPSAKLKGVTFAQFIFADTYFSNYQETQKEDDLNKFIVSLYLQKDEKFEERFIHLRYKEFKKLDKTTREAIAINYTLIREWLSLAYPLIFQKREELASTASRSASEDPVAERVEAPWIKIFQNFVGDDILHNDEWANMPVNTIFAYMTRKYKENAQKRSA